MANAENLCRRDFLYRSGTLLAGGSLLTVFAPACSGIGSSPMVKRSFIAMGSYIDFTVIEKDQEKAAKAIDAAMEAVYRIHNLMSTHESASQITEVNRKAGSEKVKVHGDFLNVVQNSLAFSRETNGKFDITVQPLLELWGFSQKAVSLPDDKRIRKVLESVGYNNIEVDPAEGTIGLKKRHTSLDVGGIGQGYAVDRAVEILKAHGIENALVNASGDIYLLGAPRGESGWLIGIQDPLNTEKVVATVRLSNMAIATSGSYENFVNIDGHRYGHILDPVTGRPSEQLLSTTVVAKTTTEADALSTTTFVMGKEEGISFVENRQDTECALIAYGASPNDLSFHTSKGMDNLHIL